MGAPHAERVPHRQGHHRHPRPRHHPRRGRPHRRARAPGGPRRAERRRARPRCCGCSPASCKPDRGTVRLAPAERHRRLPAPRSPSAAPARRCARYVARRTGVTAADRELERGHRRASPQATPAPTTATRRPSTGGWRSAPPTSTRAPSEVWADLGLPERLLDQADHDAVGRPGGPRRAGRAAAVAASTCCCSTSRPTTSTSASLDRLERFVDRPARRVVVVSHDRAFLEAHRHRGARDRRAHAHRQPLRRRLGRPTSDERATGPPATPRRRTPSTPTKRDYAQARAPSASASG